MIDKVAAARESGCIRSDGWRSVGGVVRRSKTLSPQVAGRFFHFIVVVRAKRGAGIRTLLSQQHRTLASITSLEAIIFD